MKAQQFLESKGDADFRLSKSGEYISDIMIEFAKLHVEAALKEASKKADTDGRHTYLFRREYVPVKVDKNSILNAYPLENIK